MIEPGGYELKTTFLQDFRIADKFGADTIRDTYERAFKEWREDVVYMTELTMVLNWQIWHHWENGNHEIGRLYDMLWRKAHSYCCDFFTGEDARYYFMVTD
jgi:hypothetical protein